MKRIIIYTAAIASVALALASCEKEPSFNGGEKGEMRLHVVSDDVQTKSAAASSNRIVSETIDLSEGDINLFFSAVEEDNLGNEFLKGPATKGEIITSANFAEKRSSDFNLWLTTSGKLTYSEEGAPKMAENIPAVLKGDYWTAMYNTGSDAYSNYAHWPAGNTLNFWCWSGQNISNLIIDDKGEKMFFDYADSNSKASAQSDLLFAYTGNQSEPSTKGDVNIHFYHALAAVQFCVGGLDDGVKITNIKLNGVKSSGRGTFIPSGSCTNAGTDISKDRTSGDKDTFSGKVEDLFAWDNVANAKEFSTGEISKNNTSEATKYDPIGDEATSTFFFVPQDIKDIEIEISITSSNGKQTSTLKKKIGLGSVSYDTMPEWKAGKIYRYTISGSGEVGVKVNETFDKTTKSDVKAQNTGTISSWIRGVVIANWCDVNGKAIAPYTGTINYDTANWEYVKGTFYYYKKQLPAGETTENLISSFTADETNKPDYKLSELHLEMKVIFQAVECQKDSECGPQNFVK